MSRAIEDVIAERQRQMQAEGWSFSHDDKHVDHSLAKAAATYAAGATIDAPDRAVMDTYGASGTPGWIKELWPWGVEWWKPSSRRRDLVKAAALIIAEIERLDRATLASLAKDAKFLNLVNEKVYVIVSADEDHVVFCREGRQLPHTLGRAEFDRRFRPLASHSDSMAGA